MNTIMNPQQKSRFSHIFQSKITEKSNGLQAKFNDDPTLLKERYLNTFTPEIDSFYCYRELDESRSYSLKITRELIEYREKNTDMFDRCYSYYFDIGELYINDKEFEGSFMQSFLAKLNKVSIDMQRGRTVLYLKES